MTPYPLEGRLSHEAPHLRLYWQRAMTKADETYDQLGRPFRIVRRGEVVSDLLA